MPATAIPDGPRKAAILMVLLGEEASGRIMQNLEADEMNAILREISALGAVDGETAGKILEEYRESILSWQVADEGGPGKAKKIIEKTLPPEKAAAVVESLAGAMATRAHDGLAGGGDIPFARLDTVKDSDLSGTLEIEHPQTAALVLLHLEPGRAAKVLGGMGEESQVNVMSRITRLSALSQEVAREVSDALDARFETQEGETIEEHDGAGGAAEILKRMERSRTRAIIRRIEEQDPEIAEKLRTRVYTFEMLLQLSDRDIQEVLKGVDQRQLGLALKGATGEMSDKFFRCMSTRAAEMVRDEMEYMGAAKLKDVEEAQKQILEKAMKLEEDGLVTFESEVGEGVAA